MTPRSGTSDADADADAQSTDAPAVESDHARVNGGDPTKSALRRRFSRVLVFGVLPALALLLAAASGYLKWQSGSIRVSQISSVESVAAAKDGSVAMLSYQPDAVEKDLRAARDRLTGTFKDSYTQLTHDVVIPGARQRHISAVALVFVNQTIVVGTDPPSATASSVRVTLDRVGGRWLISGFDPV